jgi:hypothetical protein
MPRPRAQPFDQGSTPFDPSLYGPNDAQPHVKGRVPFRNVSIANSDSGAFAYTHSAIRRGLPRGRRPPRGGPGEPATEGGGGRLAHERVAPG